MSDQEDVDGGGELSLAQALSDVEASIAALGGRLDQVQADLNAQLPTVSNGIGDLRGEVRALTDRVDDPTSILVREVQEELIQLTGRISGLEGAISADDHRQTSRRFDELDAQLRGLTQGTLVERLEDMDRRLGDLDEDLRRQAALDPLDAETRAALHRALAQPADVISRQDLTELASELTRHIDTVTTGVPDGRLNELAEQFRELRSGQNDLAAHLTDLNAKEPAAAAADPGLRDELTQLRGLVERVITTPPNGDGGSSVSDELVRQRLDVLARVLEEQDARRESTDEQVARVLETVSQSLDDVRSRTTTLSEQADARNEDGFEERVAELVDRVVADRLAPTADHQRHLTALVDGMAASLDAETTSLRDQAQAVRAAVTEALAGQSDETAVGQRGLVERIETLLAEHQTQIGDLAQGVGASTTSLGQVAASLERDVAAVREELTAVRGDNDTRMSAMAHALQLALEEQRESLREVVAGVTAAASAVSTDQLEQTSRLTAVFADARLGLEDQGVQLRSLLSATQERGDQQHDELTSALQRQSAAVAETVEASLGAQLTALEEQLQRSAALDQERITDLLAAVRAQTDDVMARTQVDRDDARAVLVDVLRAQVTLEEQGRKTEETLLVTSASMRDAMADTRDGNIAAVAEERAALQAAFAQSTADALAELSTVVMAAAEGQGQRVEGAVEDLGGTVSALSAQAETLQGNLAAVSEERAALKEAFAESTADALAELSAVVTAASEGQGQRVEGVVGDLGVTVSALAAQAETLQGNLAAVSEERAALKEAFAQSTADALAELSTVVTAASEGQGQRVEGVVGDLGVTVSALAAQAETLQGNLAAVSEERAALKEAFAQSTAEALSELSTVVTAAAEGQGQRVDGVVEDLRVAMSAALGAHAETLESTVAGFSQSVLDVDEARALDVASLVALLEDTRELTDTQRTVLAADMARIGSERDARLEELAVLYEQAAAAIDSRAVAVEEQVAGSLDLLGRELTSGINQRLDNSTLEREAAWIEELQRAREDDAVRTSMVHDQLDVSRANVTSGLEGVVEDVTSSLLETRSAVQAALAAQAGRIQQLVEAAADRMDARGAAMTERGEELVDIAVGMTPPLDGLLLTTAATTDAVAVLAERADDQALTFTELRATVVELGQKIETALEVDRRETRDELAALVRQAEVDLTRAQAALTHGSDAMKTAAATYDEQLHTAMDAAAVDAIGRLETRIELAWDEAIGTFAERTAVATTELQQVFGGITAAAVAEQEASEAAAEGATARLDARLTDLSEEAEARQAALERVLVQHSRDLIDRMTRDLERTTSDVTEAATGIRTMEGSLVEYLAQRDVQLAADRHALVTSLVEQLAGNLSDRQRRKLAVRLDTPDRAEPIAPVTVGLRELIERRPHEPNDDVDVPHWDGIERRAPVSSDEVVVRRSSAPRRGESSDVDVPADDAAGLGPAPVDAVTPDVEPESAPPPAPARVTRKPKATSTTTRSAKKTTKKTAKKTAKKTGSKKTGSKKTGSKTTSAATPPTPAATLSASPLEQLAAVSGVGPARAQLLLDTFGSVAGVIDATDEALLAVSGVGTKVLANLRSTLA